MSENLLLICVHGLCLCVYVCICVTVRQEGGDIREQTEISPRLHFGTRRHTQTHIPTFVEGEGESASTL